MAAYIARSASGLPSVAVSPPVSKEATLAFGHAVDRALKARGWTQSRLGAEVALITGEEPIAQATVSNWLNGVNRPTPERVFAIERALEVSAGALTLHLGYLPPNARGEVLTVLEAIDADPQLTPKERAALKAAYAAFVSPDDGSTALTSSSSRNG